MSSTAFDVDVLVVGGGPAGSSAATMLARGGRTVILFERDRFPRFHIGESLLSSANDAFDALGVQDKIRAVRFPEKWGATFGTGDGSVELYAAFAEPGGVPQPQTWQVERAEFDRVLLDHAQASGVDVRQGHRVVDATFDPDGVSVEVTPAPAPTPPQQTALGAPAPTPPRQTALGAPAGRRLQASDFRPQAGPGSNGVSDDSNAASKERYTVRARGMIDASGRWGLLARKFSLRVDEPRLANIGIFSHYSGVPRREGRRVGDIRIIARDDLGWFWLIPINAELMSVGVVLRRDMFDRWPRMSHEEALDRAIGETPAVARLLQDAKREWPVRVEKDFSYGSKGYAGDRWLLAGDAGSFLDPVFSTGVAIALESGVEAGRAMQTALEANDLTAARFATYSARQRARYLAFRRFVVGFYSRHFRDLFFQPDPPKPLFNAVVRLLAGYWQPPTFTSRVCLEAFYGAVWLHEKFRFVDPVPGVGTAPRQAAAPSP